ncbi:retrovirus-related pol polyprotein from transposon TNT 1-94 [Tanacetum coccineum]
MVLYGIRRDKCVYSLDGHAMAGELNASVEEKDILAQVWHKRLGHINEARLQGNVVCLKAMLQHVVALLTTEAEYMALTDAVKETIWLRGLLEELGVELNTVSVNCDNQDVIHLLRNHVFHERTKHINVRYHFIREVLEAKTIFVLKVGTEHNAADALMNVGCQVLRRFDEYILSNRFFKRSSYDSCVYYKSYAPGEFIYLLLYVDDMLIACKSKAEIGSTKSLLKKEFDMKELGKAKKILSMEIVRDQSRKILRVSQSGNCDVERMSKVSYANVVGSLMYLMVCTRPDIAYAVSVVSKFGESNPSCG